MTKKPSFTDDEQLFRASVGKVKAIKANTVILKPDTKPRPIPLAKAMEQLDPLQNPVDNSLENLYQEDKMAFLAAGLQKNVLKKLRKGYYGLDADIDLHGLSSRAALQLLLDFLQHSVENGKRSVLIVHGKGYHSPDNRPVLKNDLNLWLRQHQDVLAFCSAPQRSGGAGAVLVLLRLSHKYHDIDEQL
ncbi:Smr/MutS family protein [Methylomonas paludis]|uniref:Smr/MutS family protein n=1 Tax=Methylomonas paludis TaxID=1173101 RepID=A0A975MLP8_9GAMM|nr:Smr/MutS family protein [Methylomonas paludis]QWF70178.1 Smr/MutS family protein [Methylomonas paludis]